MPRVLGHGTRYREEKSPPAIKIGGIRPRGIVDVITPAEADPALVDMPQSITVVYTPASNTPDAGNVTPESLLASGGMSATAPVPAHGGNVTVRVPGVRPGEYDVQLILNYPDAAPPPASAPGAPAAPPPPSTPPPAVVPA